MWMPPARTPSESPRRSRGSGTHSSAPGSKPRALRPRAEGGRCLLGCGALVALLVVGALAFAGGAWFAVRSLLPALRERPPWALPPVAPALAGRFEMRLGAAEVSALAGGGRYRLEAPVDEMNAFLRRGLSDADTVQVQVEGDRLSLRVILDWPRGPYRMVLRGRVRRDAGRWSVEDASGSVGRVGVWSPVAAVWLGRAAPPALESIFPPRIERFSVGDGMVVVEGGP